MSVVIMTAVWQQSEAKGSARLVLLSLADQANDEGFCWPSVGSIAKRCRISERSVQDHLHTLQDDLKEVERVERPGRSTMYRVLVPPRGANLAPVQNLHPADSAPGGAESRTGGVQDSAPRTVREPSLNPKVSRKRLTSSIPDGWKPNQQHQSMASAKSLDVSQEAANFSDWHTAKGNTFKDWDAAFRTWLRRAEPKRGGDSGSPHSEWWTA